MLLVERAREAFEDAQENLWQMFHEYSPVVRTAGGIWAPNGVPILRNILSEADQNPSRAALEAKKILFSPHHIVRHELTVNRALNLMGTYNL